MRGFSQQDHGLSWSQKNEMLRVEAWGRDSFRVRATVHREIRDDLFSVLLPPEETETDIVVAEDGAMIRNGALTAYISSSGHVRFLKTAGGEELVAEIPLNFRPAAGRALFGLFRGTCSM
jgi:alpha-D-xyloside xylohydrolase